MNLNETNTIEEVLELVEKTAGGRAFFDDSRMWTLGVCKDGGIYGAQRGYLGGGMRGAIRTAANSEEEANFFKQALLRIEEIYNEETAGLESWEQNTGVLL